MSLQPWWMSPGARPSAESGIDVETSIHPPAAPDVPWLPLRRARSLRRRVLDLERVEVLTDCRRRLVVHLSQFVDLSASEPPVSFSPEARVEASSGGSDGEVLDAAA